MESTFTPIERLRAMKALMAFMESSRFAEFRQETISGCVDHLFETAPRALIRELFDEPSMNQFMMANLATEFEIDGEESLVHVFLKSPEVNELSPGSQNFLELLAGSYLRVVEVAEVEEGKSVVVDNLLMEESLTVHDASAANSLESGHLLAIRVTSDGPDRLQADSILPLPGTAEDIEDLLDMLEEQVDESIPEEEHVAWITSVLPHALPSYVVAAAMASD